MKTIQQATESQEPRVGQTRRRRGLLVLVLALSFALVAAACSSNDDSSDTTAVAAAAATTTTAPTSTAAPTTTIAPTTTVAPESADAVSPHIATVEAMYDALNAHDADAYAVYWAEDAVGWGPFFWGLEHFPVGSPEVDKGFEERRAWGAHFALSDCELVDTEVRYEEVRCLETWDDRVYHGMAGLTLNREAVYTFDEQGMITTMFNFNSNFDEVADWQEEFGPWMTATYPEITETYLVPGFDKAFKREAVFASPESIAEFTGLIEEFVAQSDTYPLAPAPVPVVVPGTEQWADTGIDLSIDDTVLIEADGAATPTRSPAIPPHGPDGHPDPVARQYNVEGLEEENHNSLIGRIGETGAPFQVGSQLQFTADNDGRLFLGFNDVDIENNSGEFTATITVNLDSTEVS